MLVRPNKRNFRTFTSLFVILLLATTWLSACGSQGANAGQGTVTIGVSIPGTGDFAGDGKNLKKGYDLWADVVNSHGGLLGRQVKIDYKTDDDSPNQATTNYTTLITKDHVDLLFGTFDIGPNDAAIRVAARYGYSLIAPSGQTPQLYDEKNPNFFSPSLSGDQYFASFVNYLLALPTSQRPKSIALTGGNDTFFGPMIDAAVTQLQGKSIVTVFNQPKYPDETTDYNPIAQQIVDKNPDAIILGSTSVNDCAAFIQAFKQQHYNPKAMICASGPDQGSDFTKAIGGDQTAEGMFVPNSPWYPNLKSFGNDEFVKAYIAKYGGTKDDITNDAVQAYSSGQVLQQAVNNAQSIDKAKVQTAMSSGTFDSIQGAVKFSLGGKNIASVAFLYQWQQGHLKAVYPADRAEANPEYPKQNWP